MWNESNFDDIFPYHLEDKYSNKQLSKKIFDHIIDSYNQLKNKQNDYQSFNDIKYKARKFNYVDIQKDALGLGSCPVASPNTRCCNLLTLDAVESCGFDCSYCSIQSFYNQDKIGFDTKFDEKLKNLQLDKDKIYHIGTGQSSDSLMWGNHNGMLDSLFDFAFNNPNVILEFKTKSHNIDYFIKNENNIPPNIVVTWSLNTPTIIQNEEHLTASLDQRINSARVLSDMGILIGFHFHPIVVYNNYLEEYKRVYDRIIQTFTPNEVVMISLGTLTFIKPVLKKIRKREFNTKILKMPFTTINGKQSYDLETKIEMFSHAYDSFRIWHNKVYFYLCMEDQSLWKSVFGYEYSSNNQFEDFMLNNYMDKIKKG